MTNRAIIQKFIDLNKGLRTKIISIIRQVSFVNLSVNLGLMQMINNYRLSLIVNIYRFIFPIITTNNNPFEVIKRLNNTDQKYQLLTATMLLVSSQMLSKLFKEVIISLVPDQLIKMLQRIIYTVITNLIKRKNIPSLNINNYINSNLIKEYLSESISKSLIKKTTKLISFRVNCHRIYTMLSQVHDIKMIDNSNNEIFQLGYKVFLDYIKCNQQLRRFKYSFYLIWEQITLLIEDEILSF